MGIIPQKKATAIFEPLGCDRCNQLGYRGRMGIYELITMDEKLRSMIHKNEGEEALKAYLYDHVTSIQSDGYTRVLEGATSLAEVLRVTSQF